MFVKQYWNNVIPKSSASDLMWGYIRKCYSFKSRFYHNLNHLKHFIKTYEAMVPDSLKGTSFELAIFFHDLFYDPMSSSNEEESADACQRFISSTGLHAIFAYDIIMSTKTHKPSNIVSLTLPTKYFIDCDLFILASSPKTYDKYKEAIRKEYHMYSDQEYYKARINFLENLLRRDSIFYTDTFKVFNKKARKNIHTELQSYGT